MHGWKSVHVSNSCHGLLENVDHFDVPLEGNGVTYGTRICNMTIICIYDSHLMKVMMQRHDVVLKEEPPIFFEHSA